MISTSVNGSQWKATIENRSFSSRPPPLSLAGGSRRGGVRRYRDNGDGLSDGEYIFGNPRVDRHHLILSYNEIHTLSFPALGSHPLLQSFHRSTQFVWFLMARYRIISSHPLPTLLEPELLFLTNSLWMP